MQRELINVDALGKSQEVMLDLFLHIGAPKCGSTSIQDFSKLNRHRLRALGIDQLGSFGRFNASRLAAATGTIAAREYWLRTGMFHSDREYDAFLDGFWDEVRSEVATKDCHAILASTEFLYEHCRSDREAISSMIFKLKQIFTTVTVIFYCRGQVEWLRSLYAQRVKSRRRLVDRYEVFLNKLGEYESLADFYYTLGIWADEVGDSNVRVGVLNRASLHGGDLLTDFLNKIGLQDLEAEGFSWPESKANVSPSFTILNVIRKCNVLCAKGFLPVRARNGIVRLLLSPQLASMGEKFPDALDQEVRQAFAQPNARFNDRFLRGTAGGLPVK